MFISTEYDNKLKLAFELYNQRMIENLPTDEELSKITFSETFETKMKKLLSLQKKSYYKLINTVGKRAVIIILTLIISLTVATFSVKALREAVIEFITETFEKYTKVSTVISESPQNDFVKTAPKYVPNGYVIHQEQEFMTTYQVEYINNENNTIDYEQTVNFGTTYNTNTENISYEKVSINSLEGIAYVNDGFSTVIFADKTYFYTLVGKISMEEIVKIAESIQTN